MAYDVNNVFAKIIRGEIPCKKVFEDEHTLAFHDINPQAPRHILLIPKTPYISFTDFCDHASSEQVASFFKTASKLTNDLGLSQEGFRLVTNNGLHGGQEVPHFHIHLMGGAKLKAMA